jgi:hypothetical protein
MAASALLTPLLMRAASRAFPPRRVAIASYDVLRPRYKAIELWSQLFAAIGGVAAACFLFALRPGNTPWLVGVIFGWLVLVPLSFIAACTLPRGVSRWREFWQYHELHYHISLRFLAPLYALLCLLGIVSTLVVLHRL